MNKSPYAVKRKQRNGDWVCSVCNNLNFSFRNQCNRCLKFPKKKQQKQLYKGFRTLVLIQYEDYVETFMEEDLVDSCVDPAVQASLFMLDLC